MPVFAGRLPRASVLSRYWLALMRRPEGVLHWVAGVPDGELEPRCNQPNSMRC